MVCREQVLAKKAFHHLKILKKVCLCVMGFLRCKAVGGHTANRAPTGPVTMPHPLSHAHLSQDIKKAKEFEVRKILRRIKQAKAEPDGELLTVVNRTSCCWLGVTPSMLTAEC